MKTQITLSQAIEGYLLDTRARRLSPRTIADYTNTFKKFTAYIRDDSPLATITTDDIRHFLADLESTPVTPNGVAYRPARILSKKTLLNIHTGLAALWTWAIREGLVDTHVVRAIPRPRPEQTAIVPFSREDVQAMLVACERSKPYARPGKRECSHTRPTAARDRAIILLLLDTGIRVSEITGDPKHDLLGLCIQDVDQRNLRLKVMGKGSKERILPFSSSTSKAIWRYLLQRPDVDPAEPLFLSSKGYPFTRSGVLQLIRRLGQRAGIPDAYPHRFRHTFAINFLRNGGNALELKRLLGHSTLEMVQRYVNITQIDVENAHKKASPVSNWHL